MVFLNLLFWAFLASYIVHILDETLLNGGFVQWIADNFWPTYTWRMFFWFNAGAIAAIAISNLLFDNLGGHWIILPLIFLAGFVTHAATVHVYWTIRRNTYSPGLLTSLLYVMIFYLLIEYGAQGSAKQDVAGLESLQEPEFRRKERKSVLPLPHEKWPFIVK